MAKKDFMAKAIENIRYRQCESAINTMAALATDLTAARSKQVISPRLVKLALGEPGPNAMPLMLSLDFKWPGPDNEFTVEALLMADVCPFTGDNLEYVVQGNGPHPCEWVRTKFPACRVMVENVKVPRAFKSKWEYDACVYEFAKACSTIGAKRLKWASDYSWPGERHWSSVLRELHIESQPE